MAPHAEIPVSVTTDGHPTEIMLAEPQTRAPPPVHVAIDSQDDYSFTFNNQNGETPLELGNDAEYTIGEHIMWAPRKFGWPPHLHHVPRFRAVSALLRYGYTRYNTLSQ